MLTIQKKRQIDVMIPTVLAAIAGIYAFKKRGATWQTLLVVVIGAFIVSYIVVSQITKYIYTSGPMQLPVGADAQNYNGKPLAERIQVDIYSWGLRKVAPYKELLSLSDGQLIAVYNAWNENYFGKDGETLTAALAGEWSSWTGEFYTLRDQILERFSRLGI